MTALSTMDDAPSALLRFAAYVVIAHHIPGRVRLKLAAADVGLSGVLQAASGFKDQLSNIPGIRSVNFNPLAKSCVVEYDPAQIPPDAWRDVVAGQRTPAAEILLQAVGMVPVG